uniref:Uncharacterized protein n=1 Tax=Oryza meridionalis TaxID=40149 RepID=A0A0E0DRS4_9ORYZ
MAAPSRCPVSFFYLKALIRHYWNRMRILVNIITQNRAKSLRRLLASLRNASYIGDEVVPISFNMDSRVDAATLNAVNSFDAEPQQDLSIVMNLLYIKQH